MKEYEVQEGCETINNRKEVGVGERVNPEKMKNKKNKGKIVYNLITLDTNLY